jgi:hypothetical protein
MTTREEGEQRGERIQRKSGGNFEMGTKGTFKIGEGVRKME